LVRDALGIEFIKSSTANAASSTGAASREARRAG
jgi:hypothetical protein